MSIIKYITAEGDTTIQMYLDAGFELYGNPMLKYNGGSTNTVLQVMIMRSPEVKEVEVKPAPIGKKKAE